MKHCTNLCVLGIDPGIRCTGWGMILSQGMQVRYIACGVITPPVSAPLEERLLHLHHALQQVCDAHHPTTCGIENSFVNRNPGTSLTLGHARGVALLTIGLRGIPIAHYAPTLVKKAMVGTGSADKTQVAAMVRRLLPSFTHTARHDATDALAIALCHAHHHQSPLAYPSLA